MDVHDKLGMIAAISKHAFEHVRSTGNVAVALEALAGINQLCVMRPKIIKAHLQKFDELAAGNFAAAKRGTHDESAT